MMKRCKDYFVNIVLLTLMFGINEVNYGAEIVSYTVAASLLDGGNLKWTARNRYIEEIEVLRAYKGEAFSVTIPTGMIMEVWKNDDSDEDTQESFEQTIEFSNAGFRLTYGSLKINDIGGYNVTDMGSGENRVFLSLEHMSGTNQPVIRSSRAIHVTGDVPDGIYDINTTLGMGATNRKDTGRGKIIIKTLPTVSVEDIDFGYHIANKNIDLTETSSISIRGGTGKEKYSLFLESETGSGDINNFIMYLDNPNTDARIPVELLVLDIGTNPRLDNNGNADLTLQARVNTVTPSEGGAYTGKAKVVFQYD